MYYCLIIHNQSQREGKYGPRGRLDSPFLIAMGNSICLCLDKNTSTKAHWRHHILEIRKREKTKKRRNGNKDMETQWFDTFGGPTGCQFLLCGSAAPRPHFVSSRALEAKEGRVVQSSAQAFNPFRWLGTVYHPPNADLPRRLSDDVRTVSKVASTFLSICHICRTEAVIFL